MKYGEFDEKNVECPLFAGVVGNGVKCSRSGMTGWSYLAAADDPHELMQFMRKYCECQYDLCPIFAKERARLLTLFADHYLPEDV